MHIDILTLFPEMLDGFLTQSMIGRARQEGLVGIEAHNIRNWTHDKHKVTDDRPFGGGAGMLLKPEPIWDAILELKQENTHTVYLCPDGEQLNQTTVKKLAKKQHLILVSGHYEGLDQRVRDNVIDQEISIGDYVLTNGTLPAAVLLDAVCRYIPKVLGEEKSLTQDSFTDNLLTFPQYTRPSEYRGYGVPEVLFSGNHAAIAQWRLEQQIEKTRQRRPDIYNKYIHHDSSTD